MKRTKSQKHYALFSQILKAWNPVLPMGPKLFIFSNCQRRDYNQPAGPDEKDISKYAVPSVKFMIKNGL